MTELVGLYRNTTFRKEYDEYSFIGYWTDYNTWHDDEYWKLERALQTIKEVYPYPTDIPREISLCVVRIMDLMMLPDWESAEIQLSSHNPVNEAATIYSRFERLKFMCRSVFSGEQCDLFDYELLVK